MDSALEVSCSVKPAVYLTVRGAAAAGASDSDTGHKTRPSGCQVVDVVIHSPIPEKIGCITFRNYYTHTITLKYCAGQNSNSNHSSTASSTKSQWRMCIREQQLMPNCHCERGGQAVVVLDGTNFHRPLNHVRSLRFILKQPSPCWLEFGIRDLHCYTVSSPFHQNDSLGMGHKNTSMSERMEKILQNGLWTKHSTTDTDSDEEQPTTVGRKLPYEINLLP